MIRSTSRSLTRHVLRSKSASTRASGPTNPPASVQARYASSTSGGGGGSGAGFKLALFGGVTVVSVAGGTLGYAGIDPEFRTYVEDNVPGAKDVFGTILGPPGPPDGGSPTSKPPAEQVPPSKMKLPKELPAAGIPVTTKVKKPLPPPPPPMPPIEKPEAEEPVTSSAPEIAKVVQEEVAKPDIIVPVAEEKFEPVQAEEKVKPVQALEKVEPLPVIEKVAEDPVVEPVQPIIEEEVVPPPEPALAAPAVEEKSGVEKASKSKESLAALNQAVEEMKVAVGMAALSGQQCVEAIGKHGQLVVGVLEQSVDDSDNDKLAWHEVIAAANEKSEAVKAAQDKLNVAKDKMEEVGRALKKVESKVDAETADKEMEAAHDKVLEISEQMQAAKKESYLIEQYRDLVEEGRQQFRKELAALLPGGGQIDNSGAAAATAAAADQQLPLTEEEMNVFVTHAYKRVASLQQQLARLKLLQQQIDQTQVSDKQLRKQVVTEQVVQEELEAQKRQLEVEHQHRLSSIREEMEAEMRCQLRRQAAAHSDHIKDSLEVQEMEINRKSQRKLDEALSEERSKYKGELSKLAGSVAGLKVAVRERAGTQAAVRNAQELWLACAALQRALEAARPESGLLPLEREVAAIKHAAALTLTTGNGDDGGFVDSVVASLPAEALRRGVYTDQTIRDRFFKVERMAKRTALIGDDGGSLLMYGLSFLQSLLVVAPVADGHLPEKLQLLDPESLSTFDIVWLARGCVERGDLEQAVRYMTLLKGEPKKVSSEWIREARLLLETRQACHALLSHAAAHGIQAFPDK